MVPCKVYTHKVQIAVCQLQSGIYHENDINYWKIQTRTELCVAQRSKGCQPCLTTILTILQMAQA